MGCGFMEGRLAVIAWSRLCRMVTASQRLFVAALRHNEFTAPCVLDGPGPSGSNLGWAMSSLWKAHSTSQLGLLPPIMDKV